MYVGLRVIEVLFAGVVAGVIRCVGAGESEGVNKDVGVGVEAECIRA